MVTIIYMRLDKFRLMRTYPTKHTKVGYNKCFAKALNLAAKGELKRITSKYRSTFFVEFEDGPDKSTLRFAFGPSKKGSTIAIDFNPKKLTESAWKSFGSITSELFGKHVVWQEFNIHALEIAMDVKRAMSDFIFFDQSLSVSNEKFLKKGTIYLGAQYGKRSYCIYDKQKHLNEKQHKTIGYPLTRVEARIRSIGIPLSQLLTMVNPFDKLVVLPRSNFVKILAHNPDQPIVASFFQAIKDGASGHTAYRQHTIAERKIIVAACKPYSIELGNTSKNWLRWIEGNFSAITKQFQNF